MSFVLRFTLDQMTFCSTNEAKLFRVGNISQNSVTLYLLKLCQITCQQNMELLSQRKRINKASMPIILCNFSNIFFYISSTDELLGYLNRGNVILTL